MFEHGFPKHWSTLKKLIWLVGTGVAGGASAVWKTVTGTLIHITDALASPMQKCEVTLEPIQAGSGDPSPDNVRPITGWTGAKVYVRGVNLWDEETELGILNTSTGADASATNQIRSKNYIAVKPNTTYYLKSSISFWVLPYDKSKTVLQGQYMSATKSNNASNLTKNTTFTTPPDCYYLRFYLDAGYGTTYNHDISINYPSTETTYHAYDPNSQDVSASFGQTVYGGKYEFVGGNGNKEQEIFDLGDVSWASDPKRTGVFYGAIAKRKAASNIIYCSIYKVDNVTVTTSKDFYISGRSSYGANVIFIRDTRFAGYTGSQVKTALQGEKIVFVLNEPTTFSSTPQPISTLKGVNNVWSNANGDTTIIYKARA